MLKTNLIAIIKSLKENKTTQVILVVLFLAAAIIAALTFNLTAAKAFIQQNQRQATLISITIYVLLSFTFVPASPLTLFLTVMLGPLHAFLIAVTGNILAALLEYHIGSVVGDVLDFEANKRRLPFGLGDLPLSSPLLLMAGRMLPVGKRGFSLVCGAYQIPLIRYLWTSALMYIIGATIVVLIGAVLIRLF